MERGDESSPAVTLELMLRQVSDTLAVDGWRENQHGDSIYPASSFAIDMDEEIGFTAAIVRVSPSPNPPRRFPVRLQVICGMSYRPAVDLLRDIGFSSPFAVVHETRFANDGGHAAVRAMSGPDDVAPCAAGIAERIGMKHAEASRRPHSIDDIVSSLTGSSDAYDVVRLTAVLISQRRYVQARHVIDEVRDRSPKRRMPAALAKLEAMLEK